MNTATRSVAVVATQLPLIDRRALSQAWFSALHVAQSSGAVVPRGRALSAPAPERASAPRRSPSGQQVMAPGNPRGRGPAPAHGRSAGPPNAAAVERRSASGELARRIERAIVRQWPRMPARLATIAIDAGEGRVQLLIRTDGAATRIVALCAPHVRERVDRALAHARFALAASGVRVEVTA
jgi:hypothetical protein